MRSVKADFVFQKQLGTGTYGVVWQATRKVDGQTYAIKELDLRLLDRQARPAPHSLNGLRTLNLGVTMFMCVDTKRNDRAGAGKLYKGGQSAG